MYFSVVCTVCTYVQIMILFDFFHVFYDDFFSYCMKVNFDSLVSLILLLCYSSFANILHHLFNSFITFFWSIMVCRSPLIGELIVVWMIICFLSQPDGQKVITIVTKK